MPKSQQSTTVANPSEQFRRCWADIDFCALRHNVAVIRECTGPGMGIIAVVKANAYGHGIDEVARELRYLVEMFGVANVTEALHLRRYAQDSPILILGPALPEEREAIVRNGLLPVVSSIEEAHAYSALVASLEGETAVSVLNVHLAVDTGMGRIGVWQEEAVAVAKQISAIPGIRLAGVATHLPVADEDIDWTNAQLMRWDALISSLREAGLDIPVVHSLNSAGTIRLNAPPANTGAPEARQGDMVRPGLMLYGSSPLPEFQSKLRPVLAWKARVTLVRDVPQGRSVSYGRTFMTPHPMRIATVAVGYADGYQRHLSNVGIDVLIGGKRCSVLGRVTMDQIMVDVSSVPVVEPGDEVVLIGRQGEGEILVSELAAKAGTIPWEIFTGIGSRVSRHYLMD